jgi:DNA polymerase-3 subunit alpha
MQLKQTLQEYRDNNNMKYGPYFYVASPEEMLERAKSLNCEEAYYNTIEVANKCNVEIQLGKYQEPIFKIEDEEDYKEFLNWKEENGHVANS